MFTPIPALVGGALIAIAVSALLLGTGRIAGISGVLAGIVRSDELSWRGAFVGGLVAGGVVAASFFPQVFDRVAPASFPVLALAGLLVGVGTRLANGCTSGHGVCGTSRLSRRSIVATGTFMAIGMITAIVVGRLTGRG